MAQATVVECEVAVDPAHALGVYANSFRVLDLDEHLCQLEFLVYSASENRAAVVQRVQLRKALLPLLLSKITGVLQAPSASR